MGDVAGRIFLSYRREDSRHVAGRLADRIHARFGSVHVFIDVDTIEPGADFAKEITDAVSSCDILLALIGRHWLDVDERLGRPRLHEDDDFVALEISAALDRGVRVIPVLVDGARMPLARDLPGVLRELARKNAVRVDHETFTSDAGNLLAGVERILRSAVLERTARQHQQPPGAAAHYRTANHQTPRSIPLPGYGTRTPRSGSRQPDAVRDWPPTARAPYHPGFPDAAGVSHGGLRTAPASGAAQNIPPVRVAWRIFLWWATYGVSLFTASGICMVLANPTAPDFAGGIAVVVVFSGASAGVVLALRREITKQRIMLSGGLDGVPQVSGGALSTRHVRVVSAICAVLSVAMGLGIACAPPAPRAGEGPPAGLSLSVPPAVP